MKIRPYQELVDSMTDEQKKKSQELFDKFYGPYKNQEPIMCISTCKDDYKYIKKVNLKDFKWKHYQKNISKEEQK